MAREGQMSFIFLRDVTGPTDRIAGGKWIVGRKDVMSRWKITGEYITISCIQTLCEASTAKNIVAKIKIAHNAISHFVTIFLTQFNNYSFNYGNFPFFLPQ